MIEKDKGKYKLLKSDYSPDPTYLITYVYRAKFRPDITRGEIGSFFVFIIAIECNVKTRCRGPPINLFVVDNFD